MQTFNDNVNIIQALDDLPNAVGGLTADQLKAKFDEAANLIKTYINTVLIPTFTSTAANASGASQIGVEEIVGLAGYTNVQDALAGLCDAIANAELGEIRDGSLTTAKLADGAVTAAKLADGAVTEDKLHSAAVTRSKIATGAVNANRCDFSSGINFSGPVRLSKNVVLTAGQTYGTSSQLPSNLTADDVGQIFFVKVS